MAKQKNNKPAESKDQPDRVEEAQATGYAPGPGYHPGTPYPGMELARAYVVIQRFDKLYSPEQALETGTLFPELYRPYPY